MATPDPPAATPVVAGHGGPRRRGKNKQAAARRAKGAPTSVIVLVLDTADAGVRKRVGQHYGVQHALRAALQRDVQKRCKQFWARKRDRDATGWHELAEQLALTRKGVERLAWGHLDASGWMAEHTSKALVMHLADAVWQDTSRHLWGDRFGKRNGPPRLGSWWDFHTLPGRARSQTKPRTWETYQLHGTLQGHLDAFAHPGLPAGATVADVLSLPPGTPVLAQPARLPRPAFTMNAAGLARVWDYAGPLTMVFHGGPASSKPSLLIPVRLPSGAGL